MRARDSTASASLAWLVRQTSRLLFVQSLVLHTMDHNALALGLRFIQMASCGARGKIIAKRRDSGRPSGSARSAAAAEAGAARADVVDVDATEGDNFPGLGLPSLSVPALQSLAESDSAAGGRSLLGMFVCTVVLLNLPIFVLRLGTLSSYYTASSYEESREHATATPVFLDFFQQGGTATIAHPLLLMAADLYALVLQLILIMPDIAFDPAKDGDETTTG